MAEYFAWDQSYDLGVREMNQEHKQLISLMNRLHEEYSAKADRSVLKQCVESLVDYTMEHFRDEEEYMARIQYPKLETHKIIHADLIRKLQGHVQSFKTEGQLKQEFFDFLQLWLSAHIRGIDMQYAQHSKA